MSRPRKSTPDESPQAKRSSGKLRVPDALTVACPVCGAPVRAPCSGLSAERSHADRFTLASEKALAAR